MLRSLLIVVLFASSCQLGANTLDIEMVVPYETQYEEASDSLLLNIQDKIYQTFVQSLLSKDATKLTTLSRDLSHLYNKQEQNLILYWQAYLQYYTSIYYLQIADKITAEKEINKGISYLKQIGNKNAEDYALLAMLQSFSIQFKGVKAIFIAGNVAKNIDHALTIDSTNQRAYYVSGSSDFYTPEKYGGGQKVETALQKAISLPAQKVKNAYLPSWGKVEAYEMLVKWYIKKEEWDLAKQYFQEGFQQFPKDYALNQLAGQLVGK